MKHPALALAAGLWLAGVAPALAQSSADARRDLDLVELRMRVGALEAQVQRLTELLREHLAERERRVEPAAGSSSPASVPRVAPEGELPLAHQMPGYPWLRVEDGVLYLQPVPIAAELAGLLLTADGWAHVLEGVTVRWEGDFMQVEAIPGEHPLARHLGVRPGDLLLTLNEHPLPRTAAQRVALARALQGQRRFALELKRGAQRVIVAFYVAPEAPPPAPLEPVTLALEQRYRLFVASQDPSQPGKNSVVLQHVGGSQVTLFVGDALDGLVVEAIEITREGEETRASLTLRGDDAQQRVLRFTRTP